MARATEAGKSVSGNWSTGSRSSGIAPGDTAYLVRQHRERGIVAAGVFTSEIYDGVHWQDPEETAFYADLDWRVVLAPEDRLPVEVLKRMIPQVAWDRLQGSGIHVLPQAEGALARLWARHLGEADFRLPDEETEARSYIEGATKRVLVNRYERNRHARDRCIEHYGTACSVCGLDFGERYGRLGKDFIHVHHLVELSTIRKGYAVDPIRDLRPVCPNCHVMLHRNKPALTITALKRRLRTAP